MTAQERAELNPPVRRKPPAKVSGAKRQIQGLNRRGQATTLTLELAIQIAELQSSGANVSVIAATIERPRRTVAHWVQSGRASSMASTKVRGGGEL